MHYAIAEGYMQCTFAFMMPCVRRGILFTFVLLVLKSRKLKSSISHN